MELQITFKHMQSKPEVKTYCEEKSRKFAKYFNGKTHVTWTLDYAGGTGVSADEEMIAHVHVLGNQIDFFGEAKGGDLRQAIDSAVSKVERQIRKEKEIRKDKLHRKAG